VTLKYKYKQQNNKLEKQKDRYESAGDDNCEGMKNVSSWLATCPVYRTYGKQLS